jgi:hypothetical protein
MVGHYDMPGWANGVTVDGGYTYVAFGDAGLQIFEYYGSAVEESPAPSALGYKPAATVIRSLPQGAVAFDAMGRKATNLRPGIYFVRQTSSMASDASSVTKVVLTD